MNTLVIRSCAILLLVGGLLAQGEENVSEVIAKARKLAAAGQPKAGGDLLAKAIARIKKNVEANPGSAKTHFQLAQLLFEYQQDAAALEAIGKAIKLDPKDPDFHVFKGRMNYYLRKPDDAIKGFESAIGLAGDSIEIRIQYAVVLSSLGKSSDALAQYKKAIEIDPQSVEARLGATLLLMEKKKNKEAAETLTAALQVDPKRFELLLLLGELKIAEQQFDKALLFAKRAVEVRPDDVGALSLLVQVYHQKRMPKEIAKAIKAIYVVHKAGKSTRTYFLRERFSVDKHHVTAVEYFALKPPFGIKYAFNVSKEKDAPPSYRISLGSYDSTTEAARALKQIGPKDRIFHLDYYRGREHRTYGIYVKPPSYSETRALVVKVIQGKLKPTSSSVRGKDPANKKK